MSVLGIGVDLVECARIQRSIDRFGDRFLHRVFTNGEIEYSMSMKFPARHLAARFAAKEAVSKAFGTGIGKAMGSSFQDRLKNWPHNAVSLLRLSLSAIPNITRSLAWFWSDKFCSVEAAVSAAIVVGCLHAALKVGALSGN